MSKIQFEQINENELEVTLPSETPMDVVQQLTKSLLSKGLVEDLKKSTLSVRYFYRPKDNANQLADKLIKSLATMTSSEESPSERRRKEMAESQGIKYEPNKVVPKVTQSTTGYRSMSNDKSALNIPKMNTFKSEDCEDGCECEKCSVEKSNYGPKGSSQYSISDNARRKANNTGDSADIGPNTNTKSYSSKPGQLSAKQQAAVISRTQTAANKKQPVRHLSPEEIEAEYGQKPLKKSWGQHLPFPSAEQELMQLAKETANSGENAIANQLAQMMQSKSMLNRLQPSADEFIAAGEAMGLGANEQVLKSEQNKWNGTINSWLAEATKPISQRFNSEEEEMAYWNSIKVADGDDGGSGY